LGVRHRTRRQRIQSGRSTGGPGHRSDDGRGLRPQPGRTHGRMDGHRRCLRDPRLDLSAPGGEARRRRAHHRGPDQRAVGSADGHGRRRPAGEEMVPRCPRDDLALRPPRFPACPARPPRRRRAVRTVPPHRPQRRGRTAPRGPVSAPAAATRHPDRDRATAYAVIAWYEWALGGSTMAENYALAAIELEPEHRLAQLITHAVVNGLLPRWLTEARGTRF